MRLTVVLTHPVQYYSPWFRYIASQAPEIELTVLYATVPTPAQQGAGFDTAFEWDTALLGGYAHRVLRLARPGDWTGTGRFFGIDATGLTSALRDTRPDVVLVPGWHSAVYVRTLVAARRLGIPALYRGDSTLATAPAGWSRPLWRLRTSVLLRLFSGWLAVGTRSREYLEAFGLDPSRILASPHAVDNRFFETGAQAFERPDCRAAARRQFGIAADRFVALFVGKLERKKRPLDLIQAAAIAGRKPTVFMVGAGELAADCHAEAAKAGTDLVCSGFLNQSQMPMAYAIADCLVLPSDHRETWGLVVNEAMAAGLPCIVSSAVGCAADLIDRSTGGVYPCGDTHRLAAAIDDVGARLEAGERFSEACRFRVERASFTRATEGLVRACEAVGPAPAGRPSVVAAFGDMVNPGGLERMSFEVVSVLRSRGASVHCLLNSWGHDRIAPFVERERATWSNAYYRYPVRRRSLDPIVWARMLWDTAVTSTLLLDAVRRHRATHVFVPEFVTALRNAPALAWLRAARRCEIIMRVPCAPAEGTFYGWIWSAVISRLVDRVICSSEFVRRELIAAGVPAAKIGKIPNRVSFRAPTVGSATCRDRHRVIFVGQLIPGKGVDLLIDAVARLAASGRDVTLDVVGQTTGWVAPEFEGYRERLFERASRPDLAGRVRFLGWREDVPALMKAAAIHCCPSRPELREAFPNVVLEAKHAGIPSVVLPTGACPELVRHGHDGWICRDVTPEALVEGLAHFLDDDAECERAGEAAGESLLCFDPGVFADRWWSAFRGDAARAPDASVTAA